jgi:hypothetical protein
VGSFTGEVQTISQCKRRSQLHLWRAWSGAIIATATNRSSLCDCSGQRFLTRHGTAWWKQWQAEQIVPLKAANRFFACCQRGMRQAWHIKGEGS